MNSPFTVTTTSIDFLADTKYDSWLDFFLSVERTSETDQGFTYIYTDTTGKLNDTELPFGLRTLEILSLEDFKIILERFGCTSYEDFLSILEKKGKHVDELYSISLYVRTQNDKIILRNYKFPDQAISKLTYLSSLSSDHITFHELKK